MRVGIVTQPIKGNYGGTLQNYAMQQVLRGLGHEPLTLDFLPANFGRQYMAKLAVGAMRLLKGRSIGVSLSPFDKRVHRPTIEFIERHIALTPTFWHHYKPSLISRHGLDALVVGSDQVWRPCYNDAQEDMFLRFAKAAPVRRVAYAASFGTADWEFTDSAMARRCSELLQRFDAVSVREASGVALAERLGASGVRQVLDPTLLLGREGFDAVTLPYPGKPAGRYLGAYILDRRGVISTRLHGLAGELGLDGVLQFQASSYDLGPGEWIDAIRSSSFFIADSFHGTVFCLLYHVPFLSLVNGARGADRFYSLLSPLGLDYALINDISEATAGRVLALQFDWDDVDRRLAALRLESMDFLTTALQG